MAGHVLHTALGLLFLCTLTLQKPVEKEPNFLDQPKLLRKHPSVLLSKANDDLLTPLDNLVEPDISLDPAARLQDQLTVPLEASFEEADEGKKETFFPYRVGFVTVHRIPEEILRIMEKNKYVDSSDFRGDEQVTDKVEQVVNTPSRQSLQVPESEAIYPEPATNMQAPHPDPPKTYPSLSLTLVAPHPPVDRKSESETSDPTDAKLEAYFDSLLPGPRHDVRGNPFEEINEEDDPVFEHSLDTFLPFNDY